MTDLSNILETEVNGLINLVQNDDNLGMLRAWPVGRASVWS